MKRLSVTFIISSFLSTILMCGGGGSGSGSSTEAPRYSSDNTEIILYSFPASKNASLGIATDVKASITGNEINLTVPHSASVSSLIAEFVSNSSSIMVGSNIQISGVTANDFTEPVKYIVYANDGSEREYTVTVTKAAGTEKKIISYTINSIDGTINEDTGTITLLLPPHSSTSDLTASFEAIGKSIKANGVEQQSGITSNDFTDDVIYTVIADDGSARQYTVTVDVELSSEKEINQFVFRTTENPFLADVTGIISDTGISLTIPYGSSPAGLKAYFETSGESVTVNGVKQLPGITSNDFTSPVTYRITAENDSYKEYTVAVTVAKSDAKAITEFSLDGEPASIDENAGTVDITFHSGKNVSNLIADFTTTGVSVKVDGVLQTSGVTANDFSSPVVYTVEADNGSIKNYTVTAAKTDDITGLWNFEYGSDGTYTIEGAEMVPGILGNALSFDGLTNYVKVPDSDALTLADQGSIEVLIKATTHRPYAGIVHKGTLSDFSDETYSLQFWGSNGTVRFSIFNTDNSYKYINSATKLNLDEWYHIIATWNSSSGLVLYINGIKDAELNGNIGQVRDSGGAVIIGAQLDEAYEYYAAWGNVGFNGIIDKVKIYNQSLNGNEVEDIYNELAGMPGSPFAAYLLSAASRQMPFILGVFIIIAMALTSLFMYNRKRSKA